MAREGKRAYPWRGDPWVLSLLAADLLVSPMDLNASGEGKGKGPASMTESNTSRLNQQPGTRASSSV